MSNQEIVELLQHDLQGEHQAIVMYLLHAYALGEGAVAAEIEGIAREEMRHLDWLADKIVGLGAKPSMEPAPIDAADAAPSQQMLKDVALEDGGIRQYRAHIEAIQDPGIRLVLSRILHDELSHRDKFVKLAEEVEGMTGVIAEVNAAGGKPAERLEGILNQGISHEYTVTLQYLFHGFMTKSKEFAEDWQNIAINEMQHIGWLAEALASRGGHPHFHHTELALASDEETSLKADIAVEREVTQAYSKQIPELEEPGLVALVERIRDHEIFHEEQFSGLLAEVEATEHEAATPCTCVPAVVEPCATPPHPPIPSVGSLKN
ncbi:MAG: ferritin-like domain-containing protein [Anaerolineae bacterium]